MLTSTSTMPTTTQPIYPCVAEAPYVFQDILVVYDLSSDIPSSNYPNMSETVKFVRDDLFSDTYHFKGISSDNPSQAFFQASPVPFPKLDGLQFVSFTGFMNKYTGTVDGQQIFANAEPVNGSNIDDGLQPYLDNATDFGRRFAPLTVIIISKRDNLALNATSNVERLKSEGAYVVTIGFGPEDYKNLETLASNDSFSFVLNNFRDPEARSNVSTSIGTLLASLCAVGSIPTPPVLTTVPGPTTTTVSTIPPTTAFTCPNGQIYIEQSITLVYNMIDAFPASIDPITNGTVILITQNCDGTGDEANVQLKNLTEKYEVQVITIGNGNFSCFLDYPTSPDYIYNIANISDSTAVQSVISEIQTSLLNRFPVCMG
ncbi:hypothetical protein FO519_007257 [Halicephalobus sp. NKZ332]|nr:hypothetical protein FO519_007257 [Halicephalobus sp. NKZ332]